MPRAPHSRALLAGSPCAKRRVLSSSCSAARSMPLSRPSGWRLTCATARKASGEACHTYASPCLKSVLGGGGGASRSSAAARRSRRSRMAFWSLIVRQVAPGNRRIAPPGAFYRRARRPRHRDPFGWRQAPRPSSFPPPCHSRKRAARKREVQPQTPPEHAAGCPLCAALGGHDAGMPDRALKSGPGSGCNRVPAHYSPPQSRARSWAQSRAWIASRAACRLCGATSSSGHDGC